MGFPIFQTILYREVNQPVAQPEEHTLVVMMMKAGGRGSPNT